VGIEILLSHKERLKLTYIILLPQDFQQCRKVVATSYFQCTGKLKGGACLQCHNARLKYVHVLLAGETI